MNTVPQPYLNSCLQVMALVIRHCRLGSYRGTLCAEHVGDLMDAIHEIPVMLADPSRWDLDALRGSYLLPYEQKWQSRGGLPLCQIFDEAVQVGWAGR